MSVVGKIRARKLENELWHKLTLDYYNVIGMFRSNIYSFLLIAPHTECVCRPFPKLLGERRSVQFTHHLFVKIEMCILNLL